MSAYNTDLPSALIYAPQIKAASLGAGTEPSLTTVTAIWNNAALEVEGALLRAFLTVATTSDTFARRWARNVEALLTSGLALTAKGSIAKDEHPVGPDLVRQARTLLATTVQPTLRAQLLANGAVDAIPAQSPFIGSYWTNNADPARDDTPGTGDAPYPAVPAIHEGDAT